MPPHMAPKPAPVKAILARSVGEETFQREHLSNGGDLITEELSATHGIFTRGILCPASARIGIPLLVQKLSDSDEFCLAQSMVDGFSHEDFLSGKDKNKNVDWLMVNVTEKHDTEYGSTFETVLGWANMTGNVLIARADKKPLYPHHVKVLVRFIRMIVLSNRRIYGGEVYEGVDEDIREMITPGYFKEYYVQQRVEWEKDMRGMGDLSELPSPWMKAAAECDENATARSGNGKRDRAKDQLISDLAKVIEGLEAENVLLRAGQGTDAEGEEAFAEEGTGGDSRGDIARLPEVEDEAATEDWVLCD